MSFFCSPVAPSLSPSPLFRLARSQPGPQMAPECLPLRPAHPPFLGSLQREGPSLTGTGSQQLSSNLPAAPPHLEDSPAASSGTLWAGPPLWLWLLPPWGPLGSVRRVPFLTGACAERLPFSLDSLVSLSPRLLFFFSSEAALAPEPKSKFSFPIFLP